MCIDTPTHLPTHTHTQTHTHTHLGLDSSLVASVIARVPKKHFLEQGMVDDLKPVKSFSIGLDGSPDLAAGQKVGVAGEGMGVGVGWGGG